MIRGIVSGREARIRVLVRGARRRARTVDAVVDTGYTSNLTLPEKVIAALGLRWHSVGKAFLADGSQCLFDVYVATIDWDGRQRRILIDEADADPLVGMQLLQGYELKMQVRPRGNVTIKRLS